MFCIKYRFFIIIIYKVVVIWFNKWIYWFDELNDDYSKRECSSLYEVRVWGHTLYI